MYVDESYVIHSRYITYGILLALLIGIGLLGNFVYFWCLFKNQRKINPDSSTAPTNSNKIIQTGKSINTINARRNVVSGNTRPLKSWLSKKSNIYLYIVTLAISDFLFCLNSIVIPVVYSGCYITCRRSYLFSWYSLKIALPLRDIFTHFGYILRVLISLDRLWALEFPFSYRTKISNSFIKYLIILCFIVACLITLPYSLGFIVVRDINLKTISNNQCHINEMMPEFKYFKLIDDGKNSSGRNDLHSLLDNQNKITYRHSLNPNAPWFLTYRKWITFSMSFIPFTITTIANIFIIRKCYKISHNRSNLKRGNNNNNSVLANRMLNILTKWCFRISHINSRTNHNEDNIKISRTDMKRREFQITILMSATNVHFLFTTIPITLYVFMYNSLIDRFSNRAELWFQNVAFLCKFGNNALSVYVTLFFDPTMKVIFCEILTRFCRYFKIK
ncbi:unnamed protein product [Gordionus sp. m RMFG-2023]